MINRILRWIAVCLLVCVAVTVFTGASQGREAETVKELLLKRAHIIENVLYGRITYEEGCRQLGEVETDTLYKKDVQALLDYSRIDSAVTGKMEIMDLKRKSEVYDRASYEGKINRVENNDGEMMRNTWLCEIGISKQGGKCRLISLKNSRQTKTY
ncbi:MAG: hypothetical protein Q4C46_02050 [Bacillota bacterium]|nr:hypothetical protein [Bacillota bacterium]